MRRVSIFPAQQPTTSVSTSRAASVCDSLLYIVRLSNSHRTYHSHSTHSKCQSNNQSVMKATQRPMDAQKCFKNLENVCTCLHLEKSFGFLQKRHFHWGTSVFFTIFAARFTSKEHLSAAPNRQLTDLNLLQSYVWVFPKIRVSSNYEF